MNCPPSSLSTIYVSPEAKRPNTAISQLMPNLSKSDTCRAPPPDFGPCGTSYGEERENSPPRLYTWLLSILSLNINEPLHTDFLDVRRRIPTLLLAVLILDRNRTAFASR